MTHDPLCPTQGVHPDNCPMCPLIARIRKDERAEVHAQHLARDLEDIRFGREEGLREAREAALSVGFHTHVEGGSVSGTTRTFIDRDEFLAAIELLRSNT